MGDTTAGIDPRDLRVSDHLSLDEFGLHLKRDDCDEQVCRRVVVLDLNEPSVVRVAEVLRAAGLHMIAEMVVEQSAPSKPDEPQGLGAVVEDHGGDRWVRFDSRNGSWWRNRLGQTERWRDIDLADVLSEGVLP